VPAHRWSSAAAAEMTQTRDLEMAARDGDGGAYYYPPPRAGAGGEELDDDGRKKRTGKPDPRRRGLFSHLLCLVVENNRANKKKNLGRSGVRTTNCPVLAVLGIQTSRGS